tara:strand:+ start:1037 stop:1543 length:507 start_codon:yes stop_codon:yes gene_type:complete
MSESQSVFSPGYWLRSSVKKEDKEKKISDEDKLLSTPDVNEVSDNESENLKDAYKEWREIEEEDYIDEDKYWSQTRCLKRLNKYYERFHEINYNLANSESFQVMATCAFITFMGFGEQLIIGLMGHTFIEKWKESREKQMSEEDLDDLADDERESEEEEDEDLDKNDD